VPLILKHPVFIVVVALTAVLWLVYLTVMLYEHRAVLRELGAV
jgi:hypothetical protein